MGHSHLFCTSHTRTHVGTLVVSFFIMFRWSSILTFLTLVLNEALAQSSTSTMMMTTTAAAPSHWYDNPVTIAIVIVVFMGCMIGIAGPLLIASYRQAQKQY